MGITTSVGGQTDVVKNNTTSVGSPKLMLWCFYFKISNAPQCRFWGTNRRCGALHHVSLGTKQHGGSSIFKFQMHHHVGFDHNRHGEAITMTIFTITDVVFVFFF